MVNNVNQINSITTLTTVEQTVQNNQSNQQGINDQLNFITNSNNNNIFPLGNSDVENELINQFNNSEALEAIRTQLISNISTIHSTQFISRHNVSDNMHLFLDFASTITNEQREMLINILDQSNVLNGYFPALTILGIFTNYAGLNLDYIASNMISILHSVPNEVNVLVLPPELTPNEVVTTTIINQSAEITNRVNEIVARNSSLVENNNQNFLTDLILRSNTAIRQIRINQIIQRTYQFILSQPQLLLSIVQFINSRSSIVSNTSLSNNNSTDNQSLRQILISIYDWLNDLVRPR